MKAIEVNASAAMQHLCLRVLVINTGVLRLRLAVGTFLIQLAARVYGCEVEVSVLDCTVFSRETLAAMAENKAASERFKQAIEAFKETE